MYWTVPGLAKVELTLKQALWHSWNCDYNSVGNTAMFCSPGWAHSTAVTAWVNGASGFLAPDPSDLLSSIRIWPIGSSVPLNSESLRNTVRQPERQEKYRAAKCQCPILYDIYLYVVSHPVIILYSSDGVEWNIDRFFLQNECFYQIDWFNNHSINRCILHFNWLCCFQQLLLWWIESNGRDGPVALQR